MNEYITEVSEAIGEINRLAVLANMEQPGSVVVEVYPQNHFISIEVKQGESFNKHSIHYDPKMIGFYYEFEITNQLTAAIGQINSIANQAARTA